MAKDKKKEEAQTKLSQTNADKKAYRLAIRAKQSDTDRKITCGAAGWEPSVKVNVDWRCVKCKNPSAIVRKGKDQHCERCQSRYARAKTKQNKPVVPAQPVRQAPPPTAMAAAAEAAK